MKKKINVLIFTLFVCFLSLGIVNAENFDCKIGNYTITYNSSGKIVSAKNKNGTKWSKNLESYFKPTKKSECPTDETAKVSKIDAGRTLYVAKIDETFTSTPATEIDKGSCAGYKEDSYACENNTYYACIWNETEYGDYCNVDNLLYVSCGDAFDIPHEAPELISFLVNLLKIATPIILIFVSIITLFKAIVSSKDDEIKKAQSSLVKKIIAAVMVFFVISIVQFVIMKVADSTETDNISKCLTCFLNNDCEDSVYYKTNVGGTYTCTYVSGNKKGNTFTCKGNE